MLGGELRQHLVGRERRAVNRRQDGEQVGCQNMRFARRAVIEEIDAVRRAPDGIAGQVGPVAGIGGQATRRAAIDAKQVKPGAPRCSFLIYSRCALNACGDSDCPSAVWMLGIDMVRTSSPR